MTSPIFAEPRAAYIHVPFCRHRCGYCDFTLVAERDDLAKSYLHALELELRQLEQPRDVDTLFFGGGTPTHLTPDLLRRLLQLTTGGVARPESSKGVGASHAIRKASGRATQLTNCWLRLVPGGEFSVEANPFGLTDEKIDLLAEAGVNRISLGAQSFDSELLKLLERDHTADDIRDVVTRLRRRFDNVSLDLIFALPGQSVDHWRGTLRQAIELQPTHISTYGLTWEKGTTFWSRRAKGLIRPAPDDWECDMYSVAIDDLAAAGYEHYEISNFARPGFRCRHNQTYWRALPYFGFGPGAARYLNGVRTTNHRSTTTWIKRTLAGQEAIGIREELSPEARAREAIVLGIRQIDGVRRDEFLELTGFDLDQLAGADISRQLAAGHIEDFGSGIRLTRAGLFVADQVAVAFV